MRIALLAHSYHKITGSSDFLAEILRKLGTVHTYFDESWAQGRAEWVATFNSADFDCIVIFQAHDCFKYLEANHPNIVFVPMYDAMVWNGVFNWSQTFNRAKTLCFSSALYREVSIRNATSAYFQYYPDPTHYPQAQDYTSPRGYYWRRRLEIDNQVIQCLTGGFKFEQFTLHNVPDPGGGLEVECKGPPVDTANYALTGWMDSEASHLDNLSKHNIYFAPRLREGIGFGFLKAMSMGLCVVAPDTPTHNEYIAQACTGVLYKPDKPAAVDLRQYHEVGCRARESIERGRRRWLDKAGEFLEFFTTPQAAFERRRFMVDSWLERPHMAPGEENPAQLPSVAVVTVCLNARESIEGTIRSVIAQSYSGLEYLIFDGGSTDGTVDVIRRYEASVAFWKSEPNRRRYEAMQQSLNNVTSDWVLFMNAGDFFISADALRRLFADVPRTADVVYGHRIYRSAEGIDEPRVAADFGWTWSQFRAKEFGVDFLGRFPVQQATAVRTQLLRELKFDSFFSTIADQEFLCRAWRHGASFFHADEFVSVCPEDGLLSAQTQRRRQEWCMIALRYTPGKAALRFHDRMQTEITETIRLEYSNRGERLALSFGRTTIGQIVSRMLGADVITKTVVMLYIALAKLRYLPFWRRRAHDETDRPKRPGTTPRGYLRFTQVGIPSFLLEARGLSESEKWGTWSDGERVELVFQKQLPGSFTLILHACAFGPNASAVIPVTVGRITRQMTMKGSRRKKYKLDFTGHGGDRTMTFSIPYPVAPAELSPGTSSDRRLLGLGFVGMRIESASSTVSGG